MCTMIRTFHPVGQGLFCTECFKIEGREPITVVYDCGSLTPGRKHVESIIDQIFHNNEVIEALYISHFDFDHICGVPYLLKRCYVKRLYLPFLEGDGEVSYWKAKIVCGGEDESYEASDEQIVFRLIDSAAREGESRIRFNDDVDGSTTITPIPPLILDGEGEYSIGVVSRHRIFEYLPVVAGQKRISWTYLPFNLLRCRRKTFFASVMDSELKKIFDPTITLRDFCINPRKYLEQVGPIRKQVSWFIHVKNLLDAELKKNNAGDVNSNSMLLFSGRKSQWRYPRWFHAFYSGKCFSPPYSAPFSTSSTTSYGVEGCLYCGDYNSKDPLAWKGMTAFYQYHKCWNRIDCIVVPHHGSTLSFNDNFLFMQNSTCVISYGKKNNFGHPGTDVVSKLSFRNKTVYAVNEDAGCVGKVL